VQYSSHAQRERSGGGRCSNTRSRPFRPRSRWRFPTPRLAAAGHDGAAQGRRRPFSVTRARTGRRHSLRRDEGSSDSRVGQGVVRDRVPNRSGTLCGSPRGRCGKCRQPDRLEASPGTGLPPGLDGRASNEAALIGIVIAGLVAAATAAGIERLCSKAALARLESPRNGTPTSPGRGCPLLACGKLGQLVNESLVAPLQFRV